MTDRRVCAFNIKVTRHGAHVLQVPAGTTGTAIPVTGAANGLCSVTWDLKEVRRHAAKHVFDGDFEDGLVELPF